MSGRGPIGKIGAFVGYLWAISLTLYPLLLLIGVAFPGLDDRVTKAVSWALLPGGAFALLRFRPSIRVDTTWFFGLATIFVAALLERLFLFAGGRLDGSPYPVRALGLIWLASLAVAYQLTFRGGWVTLKRRLSPWS